MPTTKFVDKNYTNLIVKRETVVSLFTLCNPFMRESAITCNSPLCGCHKALARNPNELKAGLLYFCISSLLQQIREDVVLQAITSKTKTICCLPNARFSSRAWHRPCAFSRGWQPHPVVAKYSNWYIALWSYLFGHDDVLTMMCDVIASFILALIFSVSSLQVYDVVSIVPHVSFDERLRR